MLIKSQYGTARCPHCDWLCKIEHNEKLQALEIVCENCKKAHTLFQRGKDDA